MTKVQVDSNGKVITLGGKALVASEGGVTPTGTLSITANGTYDVTNYASANVSVSGGDNNLNIITIAASEYPNEMHYVHAYNPETGEYTPKWVYICYSFTDAGMSAVAYVKAIKIGYKYVIWFVDTNGNIVSTNDNNEDIYIAAKSNTTDIYVQIGSNKYNLCRGGGGDDEWIDDDDDGGDDDE